MIMKQNKEKFDFKAFGQAIKAARKAKGISRNQLADTLNIAPRYIASIENSGQHPSLQILYELVTLLDVSVDQFFFPEREQEKSTRRRQLDTMLDGMSEKDLKILSATAKGIEEANNDEEVDRIMTLEEEMIVRYDSGLQKGRAEGAVLKQREIAKNLKNAGIPIPMIAETTGLTQKEVEML